MRKNNIWKILAIFFVAFLLQFLFFWLRGGFITILGLTGMPLSMIIFFVAYFIATVWLIKKYRTTVTLWIIITTIFIGSSSIEVFLSLFTRHNNLLIPDLWLRVFGVLTGIGYSVVVDKRYKIAIGVLASIFALWCSYFGFPLWLHKQNFGTFTGRVVQVVNSQLILTNAQRELVNIYDFKGKYLLLDFWSTSCGGCIQKFPLVQELYDKMKSVNEVAITSVFCFNKDESISTGLDLIEQRGFSFPCLALGIKDSTLQEIGVDCFPTVIIFNPEGVLIFRGNIESAAAYINELTD